MLNREPLIRNRRTAHGQEMWSDELEVVPGMVFSPSLTKGNEREDH